VSTEGVKYCVYVKLLFVSGGSDVPRSVDCFVKLGTFTRHCFNTQH